jgi:pimeloyl-ACP methyl ester carboxylesterase
VWVRLGGGENVPVQIVGSGPPVFFLHGGSSSGVNWAPLVAGMTDWKCLVVDRPGCGLSDAVAGGAKPTYFSEVEAFANGLVADLLDGLEVDRAHLLSTSYGSYFAMRGAAAHPDRVDHIVAIAWPMGAPAGYVPMSMRLAALPGLGAMTTRIPPTRLAVRMILKQLGLGPALDSGKINDEFIEWFLALLRHTDTMINELRANPKVITPIAGVNDRMLLQPKLLARITAPVYFIWGEDDPLGGAAVAEKFAAQFSDAELEVLPSTGHAPWIDEPKLCATLATRFLGANRSP